MITMYKDGREMEVNSDPDGIKILEANRWTQTKPKKSKLEDIPSLTKKSNDENSE